MSRIAPAITQAPSLQQVANASSLPVMRPALRACDMLACAGEACEHLLLNSGFRKGNPGAYFSTDKLYSQQDKLPAVWSMYQPYGTKVATGYDFVRPDKDRRFSYMAGFS